MNFISEDFLKDIMDYTTIKVGHDEINYGDAHFRRSDNASAIVNPFVGNLLMDAHMLRLSLLNSTIKEVM